ncbi:hypothetical protein UPYG_G00198120 [Umbra pygmaea]|uniref:Ig-like domain-containing protein n=1 Tax=Umbra pygmaea TaxID=75934 RepID=A0ABD0X3R6_UMBPY
MALRKNASMFFGIFMLSLVWKALAKLEVNMKDSVEVFLGESARITCMFTGTDSPNEVIVQWYMLNKNKVHSKIYYGNSTSELVDLDGLLTGRINVTMSLNSGEVVLNILNVALEDEREFICKVTHISAGSVNGSTLLKVFASPDHPTIKGEETGISVSDEKPSKIGSCEAQNGYPRPNITWYRDQTPLQNQPGEIKVEPVVTKKSNGLYLVVSDLYLKVAKEDKDALFYCEVSYLVPGGTKMKETNKINIPVHYPSTSVNVWVESPKGLVKEGDTVEVHCRANGNPEPIFTFHLNGIDMESENNVMVMRKVSRQFNSTIMCSALDMETDEEISREAQLSVHFLDHAVLIPEVSHVMFPGENLNATCNALSSLPTHTEWVKNGKRVAEGHTLVLTDAVLNTTGTYVCVVTVPSLAELKTNSSLHVIVQGPPEITEIKEYRKDKSENVVMLHCHARSYQTPVIIWSFSDQSQTVEETLKQTEEGFLSVLTLTVTSDITAYCKASNDQGTTSKSLLIKAVVQTTVSAPSITVSIPVTTAVPTPDKTTVTSPVATEVAPPKRVKKEGSGVIIAVIIICILLLAILGSVLYFLYKKGKIPCGRSGKQDLTKHSKDNIVVEMKSDSTEDAVLLGVNGDNKPPNDQGDKYMDVRQ